MMQEYHENIFGYNEVYLHLLWDEYESARRCYHKLCWNDATISQI